mmetsp:Transcript_24098/g.59562  ORF Transcript_24098/g.59562 Transcript_24098/m.59562 type:complete len:277 (+) Transcript_24098:264-1094(+)
MLLHTPFGIASVRTIAVVRFMPSPGHLTKVTDITASMVRHQQNTWRCRQRLEKDTQRTQSVILPAPPCTPISLHPAPLPIVVHPCQIASCRRHPVRVTSACHGQGCPAVPSHGGHDRKALDCRGGGRRDLDASRRRDPPSRCPAPHPSRFAVDGGPCPHRRCGDRGEGAKDAPDEGGTDVRDEGERDQLGGGGRGSAACRRRSRLCAVGSASAPSSAPSSAASGLSSPFCGACALWRLHRTTLSRRRSDGASPSCRAMGLHFPVPPREPPLSSSPS